MLSFPATGRESRFFLDATTPLKTRGYFPAVLLSAPCVLATRLKCNRRRSSGLPLPRPVLRSPTLPGIPLSLSRRPSVCIEGAEKSRADLKTGEREVARRRISPAYRAIEPAPFAQALSRKSGEPSGLTLTRHAVRNVLRISRRKICPKRARYVRFDHARVRSCERDFALDVHTRRG